VVAAYEGEDLAAGETLNGLAEVCLHRLLEQVADMVHGLRLVGPSEGFFGGGQDVVHECHDDVPVVEGRRVPRATAEVLRVDPDQGARDRRVELAALHGT
jgi:hypothetical protein